MNSSTVRDVRDVFIINLHSCGVMLDSLFKILLLVGSIADRDSRLREVILLTGGLTAFGALVFIVGLGVQMPIWPF